MSDEHQPLDADTEALLRSEALWATPGENVERALMARLSGRPRRRSLVAMVAAAAN